MSGVWKDEKEKKCRGYIPSLEARTWSHVTWRQGASLATDIAILDAGDMDIDRVQVAILWLLLGVAPKVSML